MKSGTRSRFNSSFTTAKYQSFLQEVYDQFDHVPVFRIAETPVFIDSGLKSRLFEACEEISDAIAKPDFKSKTENALEDSYRVPGEDDHTTFLQLDFGITQDEDGVLIPKLIEAQGFPTMYLYQDLIANLYKKHFDIPEDYSHLVGLNSEEYISLLRRIIIGGEDPKNVVLLEIDPHKQATRIDFLCTERILGVPSVCLSDLIVCGKDIYYKNGSGKKIPVHRIYNRVIFDELMQRTDLQREFRFTNEINAEWVGHPNWFFRISKFALPLFESRYVPRTWFLKDLSSIPEDLENYVLKPMFSFSGSGVIFNVSRDALEKTGNPSNFILQEKVKYVPIIKTPDEPVKCEIRMLMLWEKGEVRPRIVNNLARLSKGEMIGVKYNRDKDWVGGSVGFFERG